MDEEQTGLWAKALLLKIHVITGWSIPKSELQTILIDQFGKLLKEKYYTLNPDEVEFAFRSQGLGTQDWGKETNLQLIDSILLPYLNQRLRISETERHIAYFKQRKEFNLEKDVNWFGMINEDYQRFYGQNIRLKPWPPHYYQVLEDAEVFFPKGWYKLRLKDYRKRWPDVDVRLLFDVARSQCVMELFRALRLQRITHVFIKNNNND